jgi:hypothetical protein
LAALLPWPPGALTPSYPFRALAHLAHSLPPADMRVLHDIMSGSSASSDRVHKAFRYDTEPQPANPQHAPLQQGASGAGAAPGGIGAAASSVAAGAGGSGRQQPRRRSGGAETGSVASGGGSVRSGHSSSVASGSESASRRDGSRRRRSPMPPDLGVLSAAEGSLAPAFAGGAVAGSGLPRSSERGSMGGSAGGGSIGGSAGGGTEGASSLGFASTSGTSRTAQLRQNTAGGREIDVTSESEEAALYASGYSSAGSSLLSGKVGGRSAAPLPPRGPGAAGALGGGFGGTVQLPPDAAWERGASVRQAQAHSVHGMPPAGPGHAAPPPGSRVHFGSGARPDSASRRQPPAGPGQRSTGFIGTGAGFGGVGAGFGAATVGDKPGAAAAAGAVLFDGGSLLAHAPRKDSFAHLMESLGARGRAAAARQQALEPHG